MFYYLYRYNPIRERKMSNLDAFFIPIIEILPRNVILLNSRNKLGQISLFLEHNHTLKVVESSIN